MGGCVWTGGGIWSRFGVVWRASDADLKQQATTHLSVALTCSFDAQTCGSADQHATHMRPTPAAMHAVQHLPKSCLLQGSPLKLQ